MADTIHTPMLLGYNTPGQLHNIITPHFNVTIHFCPHQNFCTLVLLTFPTPNIIIESYVSNLYRKGGLLYNLRGVFQ